MPTISVLTYCKRRLAQAMAMIPHTVGLLQDGDELVFVDYSCEDESYLWVKAHYPQVRIVHVPGRRWYSHPHARNCAAVNARGDIFLFVDIDNLVPRELYEKCRDVPHGEFYALIPAPNKSGFCAIHRSDFYKVNGYEEGIPSYCYEDTCFYRALDAAKVARVDLTDFDVDVIAADEQPRALEPCDGDPWTQNQDIANILRKRHPYKNNVGTNWGIGCTVE